jgi:hypothetical protein
MSTVDQVVPTTAQDAEALRAWARAKRPDTIELDLGAGPVQFSHECLGHVYAHRYTAGHVSAATRDGRIWTLELVDLHGDGSIVTSHITGTDGSDAPRAVLRELQNAAWPYWQDHPTRLAGEVLVWVTQLHSNLLRSATSGRVQVETVRELRHALARLAVAELSAGGLREVARRLLPDWSGTARELLDVAAALME